MADRDRSIDFIRAQGLPFLAHLLRRISDQLVVDAGEFEAKLGISAPARTASTLLLLDMQGPQSVTQIAEKLRQSHPLVITWIGQLKRLDFVTRSADPADGRRSVVALTPSGRTEAGRMTDAVRRLGLAYEALLAEADAEILEPLWRLHDLVAQGRLAERLRLSLEAAR